MMKFKIFAFFVLLRVLSVFIVKTWYVPDEYWQSLEVAHKLTFGYGHLTWEWSKGIRSYIHPLIIATVYRALICLGWDQVNYLILAPRLLQAFFSAISDYCFYRWTDKSKWSVFLIAISWFWFYTASRTLINTIETNLTTIALTSYPRHHQPDSTKFLWIVALVCFIRPTAAIIWMPLCLFHMQRSAHSMLGLLFRKYLPIGLIVGSIAIGLDSYAHGTLVITPIEFFKFNVLEGVANFYGTQPWYWYFTMGLPAILGFFMIPFVFAIMQTLRRPEMYPDQMNLLYSILFALIVYSLLPHKEFRFILPLLPICLHITTTFLSNWSRKASYFTIWIVALFFLISNLVPAIHLSLVHQRGTNDIMESIERIAREYRDENGSQAKILFLMPCHSTPWYSHVHQNVSMRFLTCEPNLTNKRFYVDEADKFFTYPKNWIKRNLLTQSQSNWPTHIVLFDNLKTKINEFLENYKMIEELHHSEFTADRIGDNVLLFEKK